MSNTRRGRHGIVLRESRRRSRNNRAGKMSRRQARFLSQRLDQLEECIRENSRRDFIRQLAIAGVVGAATVTAGHLLSQQSQDTGNRPKGQDVRFRGVLDHGVRGGGNIDVQIAASVVATGYVSAEVTVA